MLRLLKEAELEYLETRSQLDVAKHKLNQKRQKVEEMLVKLRAEILG